MPAESNPPAFVPQGLDVTKSTVLASHHTEAALVPPADTPPRKRTVPRSAHPNRWLPQTAPHHACAAPVAASTPSRIRGCSLPVLRKLAPHRSSPGPRMSRARPRLKAISPDAGVPNHPRVQWAQKMDKPNSTPQFRFCSIVSTKNSSVFRFSLRTLRGLRDLCG